MVNFISMREFYFPVGYEPWLLWLIFEPLISNWQNEQKKEILIISNSKHQYSSYWLRFDKSIVYIVFLLFFSIY